MLRVNVAHAYTHRDLVCSCRDAMRGIPRVCEVIIELYCMYVRTYVYIHMYFMCTYMDDTQSKHCV